METKHTTESGASPQSAQLCVEHEVDLPDLWAELRTQAEEICASEPGLEALLTEVVLDQPCLGSALGMRLARKLAREDMTHRELAPLLKGILREHPLLVMSAAADLRAIVERDPAAGSALEPLLYYKGFAAITTYRISYEHETGYYVGASNRVWDMLRFKDVTKENK